MLAAAFVTLALGGCDLGTNQALTAEEQAAHEMVHAVPEVARWGTKLRERSMPRLPKPDPKVGQTEASRAPVHPVCRTERRPGDRPPPGLPAGWTLGVYEVPGTSYLLWVRFHIESESGKIWAKGVFEKDFVPLEQWQSVRRNP